MNNVIVIGLTIIGAGLLGGFAAFLVDQEGRPAAPDTSVRGPSLQRFMVVGIVAAAAVPLFLYLLQSALLADLGRTDNNIGSYFVFLGLCLVAAFTSRQFLDTISRQLMRQVEQARDEAKEALEVATDVADEQAAEPAPAAAPRGARTTATDLPGLSDEQSRVLKATWGRPYRNSSSLAAQLGMNRNEVKRILEALADKGLLNKVRSPDSGKIRWEISETGQTLLQG